MIALGSDCLLFRMSNGESVPLSAGMISVELMGGVAGCFDAEFVQHAASAVFHYFKTDLCRETVTVGEFAGALEKVLRGLALSERKSEAAKPEPVVVSDLRKLACESGKGFELFFFPRLRQELRQHVSRRPRVLRFLGLRACVKQLAGAQRWTSRCRNLEEQIVSFLRDCLSTDQSGEGIALVVH